MSNSESNTKYESLLQENEYLKNQLKLVQESSALLEQFAYSVSHDLQEPLRMVTGFLQLLQVEQDTQKKVEYFGFALDGANRMKNLIKDLLNYSLVGSLDEASEEVDVAELVKDTLRVYNRLIQTRNAAVKISEMPVIKGVRSLITQVFDNLISNALKYNDKPQPEVNISFFETATHTVFSIQDNGIGINSDKFDFIYQPFKRLHAKHEYSGNGIGLAICKKIAEKHQGTSWVESNPGEGAKFFFSIKKQND
jgi:light-regulated signal transduction histidine kinase (bacteriophytochrome)